MGANSDSNFFPDRSSLNLDRLKARANDHKTDAPSETRDEHKLCRQLGVGSRRLVCSRLRLQRHQR